MSNVQLFFAVFPWLALGLLLVQLWAAGSLNVSEGAVAAAAAILGGLVAHVVDSVRDARREQREDELRFLDVRRELYARFNAISRDVLVALADDPHDVEARRTKIWETGNLMNEVSLIAPDAVLDQLGPAWGAVRDLALGQEFNQEQLGAVMEKLRALQSAMRADVRPPSRRKANGT